MTPEFRIIERDGQLRVQLPDGALDGFTFRNPGAAGRRIEVLRRLGGCVERPCMSCRKPFLSEGNHNRMCPVYRRASAMDPYQIGRRNGVA